MAAPKVNYTPRSPFVDILAFLCYLVTTRWPPFRRLRSLRKALNAREVTPMAQLPALDQAQQTVAELVERFARNVDEYQRSDYKEIEVRHEYIDPFFEALGWDVHNRAGHDEQYKDVIHEESVRVGAGIKAPDYTFRLGRERKFFVEAKKPSINVKDDAGPAYQLRRYAWSAHLPLSILTDFQELAVYDCTQRPNPSDKAGLGRVAYYTFEQYPARLPEIWETFAKENVWRGSFDRYAQSARAKRGTSEVDDEFLREIERWRDALAHNLALRNPQLCVPDLNYAVQATIDRIVFLRVAEDRGIEEYGRLQQLVNGANAYPRLTELYRQADQKYNSGLFDFAADTLSMRLGLDDKPLQSILSGLYYPQSPYEFSVIGAEILGQVYEQFLGKVIRLTAGHRAVVEEKPEVKKAGGVYYTPRYIVDYIVQHTVGELVKGKSPAEIAGSQSRATGRRKLVTGNRQPETDNPPLRVLDPACGSGSFLLGAYRYLLEHCLNWYAAHDPEKWAAAKQPPIRRGAHGGWWLTTAEKKRILLTHIYGVDIDRQAVEVTKLSLLLKVLEGESQETLGQQLSYWQERALPDLGRNVQCGNSLIGPDYWQGRLMQDEEEIRRVNAFDWQAAFPEAMGAERSGASRQQLGEAAGGFDALIGNPPYIRIQMMREWAPTEVEFYKQAYVAASKGNYDIYVVFVERGLSLLNPHGRLGFILPHKFFNAQYGEPLRGLIAKGRHLSHVVHFGDQQVFENATTYTCLMFLDKAGSQHLDFVGVHSLSTWKQDGLSSAAVASSLPTLGITSRPWNFATESASTLLSKLQAFPTRLEQVTSRIFQGIKTGADRVYVVEELERAGHRILVLSRQTNAQHWLEPDLLHPLVKGGDSRRYHLSTTNRLILFPYSEHGTGKASLVAEAEFRAQYPLSWSYLLANRAYLEQREDGKMTGPRWYAYTRTQALDVMPMPKVITPDIAMHASFSLDPDGTAFFSGGVAGGYGILVLPRYSREYALGLLNSRLLEWMIRQSATQMRGGYYSFESRFIRDLPIRTIDFTDPADVARHDRMVALVERMLELHRRQAAAQTPADRELYARQIAATDREIDALVYELYGLTEEEIGVVEGCQRI